MSLINPQIITDYQQQGAVYLPGIFTDWVDTLRQGVQYNHDNPGPYFAENVSGDETGSFWDDYCNWQRISEFEEFITGSSAAQIAAEIMQSSQAQFFHDHVLVKEAHTSKPTPWHQDSPYYFISGEQTVSFWLPLDPVDESESLRFIAGSHRWEKSILPVKWLDDSDFYNTNRDQYIELGNPDAADSTLSSRCHMIISECTAVSPVVRRRSIE